MEFIAANQPRSTFKLKQGKFIDLKDQLSANVGVLPSSQLVDPRHESKTQYTNNERQSSRLFCNGLALLLLLSGSYNVWQIYFRPTETVAVRQLVRPAHGHVYYAPHFELISVQGKTTSSSELLSDVPLVICFGSTTCDRFLGQEQAFVEFADRNKGYGRFLEVYTHEAHPNDQFSASCSIDDRLQRADMLFAADTLAIDHFVDPPESGLGKALGVGQWGYVVLGSDGAILLTCLDGDNAEGLKQIAELLHQAPDS